MFAEEAVVRCTGCGEELYDGDTAYLLDGKYYCTACIDDGFTVVRCDGSDEYDENEDE